MTDKASNFIGYLWHLDRKGFAELRRSLNQEPGQAIGAIPFVEAFTLTEPTTWNRQVYYLVAGLFCMVERPLELGQSPPATVDQNLGASIAQLYFTRDRSVSVEHRFIRLLDADAERLPDRLRQMTALLRANLVPIAWERLLKDLMLWNTEKRTVQHLWARSYYAKTTLGDQSEQLETEAQANGGNE